MRLLKAFIHEYPLQCFVVWVCLVAAGIGEGVSLSTLLPVLGLATGSHSVLTDNRVSHLLTGGLHLLDLSPTLPVLVTIVVIGLLIKAGLTLVAYRQVGYTVASIATGRRLDLLRALSGSRWEYFLRQRSGSLANAISTEATRSSAAFQSCATLTALLSQAIVFFIVALLVNWHAAAISLAIGAVIFVALREMVKMARRAGRRQKDLFRSLMALLTDSLASLKPLKSMAREREMDRLLERQTTSLNRALQGEVLSREALKAVQELLIGLVLVGGVALSLGVWHLQLAEVMVLTVVLARMLTKLSKLQQEYQTLAVSESFYWSMQDSIQEARAERERPFGDRVPSLARGIRFENVDFGYDDKQVLYGASLEIPAGQFTSLIGFSGAGKTTMVDLLIGLLRARSGRILIDDEPIDGLDIRRWREMIGYVPQDTVLLHDSVFNNVIVGNERMSEDDAIWALKKSGAWDFVAQLPEGIHTSVGEHGGRFSGGQRQRIVIARALVHRPKLLILDEATSALDPATEQAVSATLHGLGEKYTVLAISHRAALTDLSDRVYRIENGQAVRVGADEPAEVAADPVGSRRSLP